MIHSEASSIHTNERCFPLENLVTSSCATPPPDTFDLVNTKSVFGLMIMSFTSPTLQTSLKPWAALRVLSSWLIGSSLINLYCTSLMSELMRGHWRVRKYLFSSGYSRKVIESHCLSCSGLSPLSKFLLLEPTRLCPRLWRNRQHYCSSDDKKAR